MTGTKNIPKSKWKVKDRRTGKTLTHIQKFRLHKDDIAAMYWGWPVKKRYPTNRKGAGFYMCKGTGGYIIDGRCLTEKEIDCIQRQIRFPTFLRLYVQVQPGGVYVVQRDTSGFGSRQGKYTAPTWDMSAGPTHWMKIPIYQFGLHAYNDIDVLHTCTDIRSKYFK